MLKKRVISFALIITLVFTSISVVYGTDEYGMKEQTQGDVNITSDNTSDSGIGEETTEGGIQDDPATGESINTPEITEDAIQPKTEQKNNNKMKAAQVLYDYKVMSMDSNGNMTLVDNLSFSTVAQANAAMTAKYNATKDKKLVVANKSNKIINMISGIAYFKSGSATANVGNTYITPGDAMHFYGVSGTNNENTKVGISGAVANVSTSKLILIPESLVYPNTSEFYYRDFYTKNSSGDMVHYVYKVSSPNTGSPYKKGTGKSKANSGFVVDKAPSWMGLGGRYYSPDGINFYSDPSMTARVGSAYYPYYKNLPYRSMSDYTSTDLNNWINYRTKSVSPTSKTSKLKDQGRNFINAQNRYGVNAVNELAFACLESAYGKSNYALNRNNLFGINAVDSNPNNAYQFSSVRVCINEHANRYLNRGYGDVKSDSRYNGLTPGNKGMGVNVKYASDPWHGEKISGIAYAVDKYLGSKDYRKFTVGVTNKNSVSVYKNPGSTYLYNLSNKSSGKGPAGIPVIILGSSGNYYMVQSELPISGNSASFSHTYYYSDSIAYVSKNDINVVNNGSRTYATQISKNNDLRDMTVKVGSKNYFSGFNPDKTSYTVTVPKNTKTITINGTRLMSTSTVSGNGKKNLNKKTKTYNVKVKPKSGSAKTYKVKVVPKGAAAKSTFKFGVYNSKTKLSNKSKRGKRTSPKRPLRVQTKIKTNSKKTTVKMVIYNKKKKVVAQKTKYIKKTKTVKFTWNGKYTKHNKLKKKAGKYATRSKKGTKYYVRFIVSRKGTKTHKGKYHTFRLYK